VGHPEQPVLIWGKISDSVARGARIDSSTHATTTIEYEHHEIHDGSAFMCTYENLCTNTNERSVIAFNTPDTTKWIHLIATASSTAISRFSIAENTSIDVDEGTQLAIYNKNRNSTKTSGVTSIETTPVANKATSFNETQAANANITTTTTLASIIAGGSSSPSGKTGIGGSATHQFEWVLEQNQQYAFIVESLDDSDNYHTLELNWYEHTSKD